MNFNPISPLWLTLGEKVPCAVYLYFRASFVASLQKGEEISLNFYEKLQKAKPLFVYINKNDAQEWQQWTKLRHPQLLVKELKNNLEKDGENIYGNIRREYLSHAQKCIQAKDLNNSSIQSCFKKAHLLLSDIINNPMLNWYFDQFHEPRDLLYHSAEVSFLVALFSCRYQLLDEIHLENILFASILHELEGDPQKFQDKVVSVRSLEILEKQKMPLPSCVKELLEKQDELCSGKGFPNGFSSEKIPDSVKIFSLCNHFIHQRLKHAGTRRMRFNQSKKALSTCKADFDPKIWDTFWDFLEKEVELFS